MHIFGSKLTRDPRRELPGSSESWVLELKNTTAVRVRVAGAFRVLSTESLLGDTLKELFLKYYEEIFPHTPIFVAEYHNPGNPNLQGDLEDILSAAATRLLLSKFLMLSQKPLFLRSFLCGNLISTMTINFLDKNPGELLSAPGNQLFRVSEPV